MVCDSEDKWDEDKLKRTTDDIDELCKKYPWLRELGRGYMIATLPCRLGMITEDSPKIFYVILKGRHGTDPP